MLRGGDRGDIARIPAAGGGIIAAQETTLGFGQAQQADNLDLALGPAVAGAIVLRHEAAIDHQGEAGVGHQRRHHPETGAAHGDGLGQHRLVMQEMAGCGDAAIFVVAGNAAGGGDGRGMDAGVDPCDQVALPGEAIDLPAAERAKTGKQDEGDQRQADRKARGAPAAPPDLRGCHGISLILCIADMSACGIMFALRWNMTHIEPDSTMTTRTMVSIIAMNDQPPSTRVFMCRK